MEATTEALIRGYIQKSEKKLEVAQRLFDSGDYEDAVSRRIMPPLHNHNLLP